jgi:hypothetical protein
MTQASTILIYIQSARWEQQETQSHTQPEQPLTSLSAHRLAIRQLSVGSLSGVTLLLAVHYVAVHYHTEDGDGDDLQL